LVGGLEHLDYFSHHIGNVIIPTDELHHFSEGLVETTNQAIVGYSWISKVKYSTSHAS